MEREAEKVDVSVRAVRLAVDDGDAADGFGDEWRRRGGKEEGSTAGGRHLRASRPDSRDEDATCLDRRTSEGVSMSSVRSGGGSQMDKGTRAVATADAVETRKT